MLLPPIRASFSSFLLRVRCSGSLHTLLSHSNRRPAAPRKRQHFILKPRTHRKNPDTDAAPSKPLYTRELVHKISGILRTSTWSSAQEQLSSLGLRWDSHIVCKVLKTHPPMEKAWLFFLWAAHLDGFKHDQFTYTTMLDIFGEAGRIESMDHLFREMERNGIKIDTATYTSVMHWRAKDGDFVGAARAWDDMRRKGCWPTVVSYTAFMKILFDSGKPEAAAEVYQDMLEAGVPPSCHTYTVVMEHLAVAGKFDSVLDILREMQEAGVLPDKAACNILVGKCAQARETAAILHILQYMREQKLVLRRPIFLEALKAFRDLGESDHLLREVNGHLALEGVDSAESLPCDIGASIDKDIIYNLLARKSFIAIDHLLKDMIHRKAEMDSELFSAVIQANCMDNRLSGALMAFRYCIKLGKMPDLIAYKSLLGQLIRMHAFQEIIEVIEQMITSESTLEPYLVSLLIMKLGCAGMLVAVRKFFHSLSGWQNTVTYTALMHAYFQNEDSDEALELYSDMKRKGIPPSLGTIEVLIAGLEASRRFQDAEAYKKEKKTLRFTYHTRQRVSMEENLCDQLFNGV